MIRENLEEFGLAAVVFKDRKEENINVISKLEVYGLHTSVVACVWNNIVFLPMSLMLDND